MWPPALGCCLRMNKMKKIIIIFYCLLFSTILPCSANSSIEFKIQTDKNISYNEWNDISALKNNSIVVIENGQATDKFTTEKGEEIEILSINNEIIKIRTKQNSAFTPGPSAPYWSDIIFIFSYKNKKLNELICYPENQGSQSGPNIKLLKVEFENNKGLFSYSYQQYGDSPYAGIGTIQFNIQEIKKGIYYVTDYKCNVNGYFHLVDAENEIAVPDKDGEIIVQRDITKMDFFQLFPVSQNIIIYDTAIVDKICLVYENLRLREKENTSSKTIKIMKTGEYVKIIKVGKKEIIDDIPGNWCYVEIVKPKYNWDLKNDIEITGIKGWCFSGYLK